MVSEEHQGQFKELCHQYKDVFSTHATDIGRTKLVVMDIDTGDSPHISQKPCTLPLTHAGREQKELEMLKEFGVIVRSVSPRESPQDDVCP